MRSGFKMKQSPAKRGEIQGTIGHNSALKASPAKIGGLSKIFKGGKALYNYVRGGKEVAKKVVTTTSNASHKVNKNGTLNKTTKAYKEMIAKQNANVKTAVSTAAKNTKTSKTAKLMKTIGVGTTVNAADDFLTGGKVKKGLSNVFGVGGNSTEANATPEVPTKQSDYNMEDVQDYFKKKN